MAKEKVDTLDYRGLKILVDEVDVGNVNSVAAITDSTGGTPSTTAAAITAGGSYAQADMVAVKNAIASILAQLNKLA